MEVKNNKVVVCRLPITAMFQFLSARGLGAGRLNSIVLSRQAINPYVFDVIHLEAPMVQRTDIYSRSNTGFHTTRNHSDYLHQYQAFFETTDGHYVKADTHLDLVLV